MLGMIQRKRSDAEAGYTLTEMLIVVVILGLIAAALTPTMIGQLGRAKAKAARLQIETVAAALEAFRTDTGRYPTPAESLGALVEAPSQTSLWLGPYLRSQDSLNDPWQAPFLYSAAVDGQSYQLKSLGADRRLGGVGVAADIEIQG